MTVSLTAIACLVILDLQHLGKPGKKDLGAAHDLDGDGLIEQGENEAELTPIYVEAAKAELEAAGAKVVVLKSGSYSSRWKQAAKLAKKVKGPVAYVACHLNKGGGNYGLVLHDSRSSGGERLAREVCAELQGAFSRPELERVLKAATSKDSADWPRPIHTIAGIYDGPANLSGVCFEPLFLDTHAELLGALTARESAEKTASEKAHKVYLAGHSGKRRTKTGSLVAGKPTRSKTAGEIRASARQSANLGRVGRSLAGGVARWLHLNR